MAKTEMITLQIVRQFVSKIKYLAIGHLLCVVQIRKGKECSPRPSLHSTNDRLHDGQFLRRGSAEALYDRFWLDELMCRYFLTARLANVGLRQLVLKMMSSASMHLLELSSTRMSLEKDRGQVRLMSCPEAGAEASERAILFRYGLGSKT